MVLMGAIFGWGLLSGGEKKADSAKTPEIAD
jgi:hypothetical protein